MRPPKIRGHWLWGSVAQFQKAPYLFPAKVASENGGAARFRLLHRRFIAISDPVLYEHIMVRNHLAYERGFHFKNQHVLFGRGMISTEGDEWARKRTRGAPAFNREAIKRAVPLSVRTTEKFLKAWDHSEEVSLIPEMQKLTVSIICQALFSVDIDHANSVKFCDAIRESGGLIRKKNTSIMPIPLWVPTKGNAELLANKKAMDEFVLDKISQRTRLKAAGTVTSDILDVILGPRDYDALSREERQELLDECKTLLVAGFETTALTLTWALYLLARHPEVAQKWRTESDEVLKGSDPQWEDLEKLFYTRQIILETMRLYPIVFTQPRECVASDAVGELHFKKGDVLLLSVWGMHRSKAHWQDPDVFRPERFAEGAQWPRQCYMPFGKGKHTCVGNNFAIYEMLVILSMIARRFDFELSNHGPVGIRSTIVLVPDRDIFIRLRKR